MPTWHQEREGKPLPVLWHHELWTVVEPNGHLCVSRFRDPVAAQRYADNVNRLHKKGAYVLPPEPIPGREDSTIATTEGHSK